MQALNESSLIEEVLKYIVACYGAEIYQDKQRLSNLIADLYTGEERLKRLYRRMVTEDAVSQQLYAISLKPIQEREGFYNRLVFQFKEANFLDEVFARQVLDAFLNGMNLLLVEPISTKATEEDGEWVDEYGVKYSADRKKLIDAPESLYGNYRVLEGTVVICERAFSMCMNLREVVLPLSVTSIGNSVFFRCGNLCKITIPSSITSIGKWAFSYCKNLCKITIPSGVTNIGESVFKNCSNLREIILPSSVTSIGKEAFLGCNSLREIKVGESNKVYRSIDSVLYTKDLKTIICYPKGKENEKFVIPSGVTSIGDGAFRGCSNLQEINIPPSVISIGNEAFSWCKKLCEITLPSSVTSIGDEIFSGCKNLQEIKVAKNNRGYKAIDGVLYTKDLRTIICYPEGKKDEKFVIPLGVMNLGDYAFQWCDNLREIVLPLGATNIGCYTFFNCDNLREITIPSTVTNISEGGFGFCENLRKITLPFSITNIGKEAFDYCSNLQQINIPAGTLDKFKKLLPEWTNELHEV